jgi:hypothetical protein
LARKVRQALDADVEQFLPHIAAARATADISAREQSTGAPAATAPLTMWRDDLNAAADVVLGVDSLGAAQPFDGSPEWIRETLSERRPEILDASAGLVRQVTNAVRSGVPEIASMWLDLVPTLAPNPLRGGSTALLNLLRAPGAVLFHAGGLAACAQRDDALTGLLLTDRIQVDDPYYGARPAVVSLRADLVYDSGWPSQQLRDYLVPILAEAIGERRAGEAWERWMYLVSVATTYLGSVLSGVYSDHPYLRVSGHHMEALNVTVGAAIQREVAEAGDDGPLLTAGLCGQSADIFEGQQRPSSRISGRGPTASTGNNFPRVAVFSRPVRTTQASEQTRYPTFGTVDHRHNPDEGTSCQRLRSYLADRPAFQ